MGALAHALTSVQRALPHGGSLPAAEWEGRHRALVRLSWIAAAGLVLFSTLQGYGVDHNVLHVAPVLAFAALAASSRLSSRLRSAAAAMSLLSAAAVLVHATNGLIEAHFAFFVLIVTLTLYEDWLPFVVAVVFVLVHHGVAGMIDPEAVYSGTSLGGEPWKWAGVHAAFITAAGVAGIVAWRFNETVRHQLREVASEREQLVHRLEALARQDPLTSLANRRAWHERLVEELKRANRAERPLSVAVLDLDDFKGINDRDGHAAGDRLLRGVAGAWQSAVRETDYVGRLGGDEFAVIFPSCSGDEAVEVVERMRAASPDGVTCSVGVASWDGIGPATELLRRADKALYRAKDSGRDRAVVD